MKDSEEERLGDACYRAGRAADGRRAKWRRDLRDAFFGYTLLWVILLVLVIKDCSVLASVIACIGFLLTVIFPGVACLLILRKTKN